MANFIHVQLCVIQDGCPNQCNNNGACQLFHDGWRCSCREGWKGDECKIAMELGCEDGVDDDNGRERAETL